MLVYMCPSDRKYLCSWEGNSGDILEHFSLEHEDLLIYSNTFRIDTKIPSENYLLFFEDEIFLVQHKVVGETNLNLTLRYLGPAQIASKVTYDIMLHANSDLLDKDYTERTENGYKIKLEELHGRGIEYLNLTIMVNGTFSMDSSRKSSIDDAVYENINKDDVFFNLPHLPIRKQMSYDENRNRGSYENINVLSDDENEIGLHRSKTVCYEDVKKRNVVKRAYSSVSLECIQEDETDMYCTNCGDMMIGPPIFLCPNKHRFCGKCSSCLCKICVKYVTKDKDLEFENKIAKRPYSCKNRKNGCTKAFLYKELLDHQTNCKFCDYKCPINECSFTGHFKNMHKHLRLIHSSVKILESFIVVFQKNNEAFLVNEDKGIFYCYHTISTETARWYAKFCGPKERRFFCELKFKDGKVKKPILLTKNDDTYGVHLKFEELKREKLKAKNAVLTITC